MTIKLKRIEICDLMLACSALADEGEKWKILHEKLKVMIDEFDAKQPELK